MCSAIHQAYRDRTITYEERVCAQEHIDQYLKALWTLALKRDVARKLYLTPQLRLLAGTGGKVNWDNTGIYADWANRPYLKEIQDETER